MTKTDEFISGLKEYYKNREENLKKKYGNLTPSDDDLPKETKDAINRMSKKDREIYANKKLVQVCQQYIEQVRKDDFYPMIQVIVSKLLKLDKEYESVGISFKVTNDKGEEITPDENEIWMGSSKVDSEIDKVFKQTGISL